MRNALIVEDDHSTCTLVSMLLTRLGFVTWTASTVADALDILEHQPDIDLITLDMLLPGVPGYKLLEIVRERFPKTMTLIVSAHLDHHQHAPTDGFGTSQLMKPFNRQQFDDAVMQVARASA